VSDKAPTPSPVEAIDKIIREAYLLGFDAEERDALDYFDGFAESEDIISELVSERDLALASHKIATCQALAWRDECDQWREVSNRLGRLLRRRMEAGEFTSEEWEALSAFDKMAGATLCQRCDGHGWYGEADEQGGDGCRVLCEVCQGKGTQPKEEAK
jgi:hypothetical protein